MIILTSTPRRTEEHWTNLIHEKVSEELERLAPEDAQVEHFVGYESDEEFKEGEMESGQLKGTSKMIWRLKKYAENTPKSDRRAKVFFYDFDLSCPNHIRNFCAFNDIDVEIYSITHGGYYEPHNVIRENNTHHYMHFTDARMHGMDKVFVSTEFHKEIMKANDEYVRKGLDDDLVDSKVEVTGLPLPWGLDGKDTCPNCSETEFHNSSKTKRFAAFVGKLREDKGMDIAEELEDNVEGFAIKRETLPYDEYMQYLTDTEVVVSPARKETFGYAVIEAVMQGCLPVVRDGLCYREVLGEGAVYVEHERKRHGRDDAEVITAKRYANELGRVRGMSDDERMDRIHQILHHILSKYSNSETKIAQEIVGDWNEL